MQALIFVVINLFRFSELLFKLSLWVKLVGAKGVFEAVLTLVNRLVVSIMIRLYIMPLLCLVNEDDFDERFHSASVQEGPELYDLMATFSTTAVLTAHFQMFTLCPRHHYFFLFVLIGRARRR